MAKTVTAEAETSQKNEARRQRKRQARREAKIMLKIERSKKAVQKTQKKLTRTQANLNEEQTHLHDLEAKLQQIRTTQEPQAQEAQEAQVPQDSASEELQPSASQTFPGELPELKPEDFQTQEAVDQTYQEPLFMPASTPPQADTEAIEAFHTASTTPAEGRDDIASDVETDQTQEAEQSATPEDATTTEESPSALRQDEDQSLIEHGNEEPELSNNPLAAEPGKDETPDEALAEASDENKEENLQA